MRSRSVHNARYTTEMIYESKDYRKYLPKYGRKEGSCEF